MMMMMMMIFAHHLSSLPNALVVPRKDAAAKVAREHVKVALIVVSSPFYFGKDF